MSDGICTPPPGLLIDWWDGFEAMHYECPVVAVAIRDGYTNFLTFDGMGEPHWVEIDSPRLTLHFGE